MTKLQNEAQILFSVSGASTLLPSPLGISIHGLAVRRPILKAALKQDLPVLSPIVTKTGKL
jgi:hypothetical protein